MYRTGTLGIRIMQSFYRKRSVDPNEKKRWGGSTSQSIVTDRFRHCFFEDHVFVTHLTGILQTLL